MDETQMMHKKRRQHDPHYQSDYHSRYKKHNMSGQRDDWRSGRLLYYFVLKDRWFQTYFLLSPLLISMTDPVLYTMYETSD